MKIHIDRDSSKILKSCIGHYIDDIYLQKLYRYSSDGLTKSLDKEYEYAIFIDINNYIIKITNSYIETDDFDEYPAFKVEVMDSFSVQNDSKYYNIGSTSIQGVLKTIDVVNDCFSSFTFSGIIDVDIAIKFLIDSKEYYLVALDSYQGMLTFFDVEEIKEESSYMLRNILSEYWVNKAPDLKYFKRVETSINNRIVETL